MRESVDAQFSRIKVEAGLWDDFAEGIFYQPGEFADRAATATSPSGWSRSTRRAARAATGSSTSPRRPSAYEEIVANLGRAGLQQAGRRGEGWARIVVEKPFGHDLDVGASSSTTR